MDILVQNLMKNDFGICETNTACGGCVDYYKSPSLISDLDCEAIRKWPQSLRSCVLGKENSTYKSIDICKNDALGLAETYHALHGLPISSASDKVERYADHLMKERYVETHGRCALDLIASNTDRMRLCEACFESSNNADDCQRIYQWQKVLEECVLAADSISSETHLKFAICRLQSEGLRTRHILEHIVVRLELHILLYQNSAHVN